MPERYEIEDLAADLRRLRSSMPESHKLVAAVAEVGKRFVAGRHWLTDEHRRVHPKQGIGVHLLHEEPDHSLPIFVVAWGAGRGAPPHNHGAGNWAVIVGIEGAESNTWWRRLDDGSIEGHAEVEPVKTSAIGPDQAVTFLPNVLHSVDNGGEEVTVSLHIYATHLNYIEREQFDPEAKTVAPFKVAVD
jgi:predicted metal-dependent enzyme (double-stranded beta helix superfamily)